MKKYFSFLYLLQYVVFLSDALQEFFIYLVMMVIIEDSYIIDRSPALLKDIIISSL